MNLLSIPQLAAVSRRSALGAVLVAVVGTVASGLLGHLLFGVGLWVGIGLALFNFRLIQHAALRASARGQANTRRPLAMNTLARLGAVSAVAFGVVLLSHQIGFGTLVGLALFQFVLLANVTGSLLRSGGSLRQELAGSGSGEGGAT